MARPLILEKGTNNVELAEHVGGGQARQLGALE